MSHFAVLVVGENVEEQLQPYHEFECTGVVDQYVVSIDETEQLREQYKAETRSMIKVDGEWVCAYDDRFYRDPTPEEQAEIGNFGGTGCRKNFSYHSKNWGDGRGYRSKVRDVSGYEVEEVPCAETMTFAEYIDYQCERPVLSPGEHPILDVRSDEGGHKYGWTEVDENGEVIRTIDRTNPNRKWDWWVIGGRYRERFLLKPGAQGGKGELSTFEKIDLREGKGIRLRDRWVDQARKGDIDFEGMRKQAAIEANERYDKYEAATKGIEPAPPWLEVRKKHEDDIDAARDEYSTHPWVAALREHQLDAWGEENLDVWCVHTGGREAFVQRAKDRCGVMFAVVKDGEWHERGSMGWWGVVHDEKDQDEWCARIQSLYDSLPDDTLLTVVDCHI